MRGPLTGIGVEPDSGLPVRISRTGADPDSGIGQQAVGIVLRYFQQAGQVRRGESGGDRLVDQGFRRCLACLVGQLGFQMRQIGQLVDPLDVDTGSRGQRFRLGPFFQGLVHQPQTLRERKDQSALQIIETRLARAPAHSQQRLPWRAAADGLLKGFQQAAAKTHDFSRGLHAGIQPGRFSGKAFKFPAGQANGHRITGHHCRDMRSRSGKGLVQRGAQTKTGVDGGQVDAEGFGTKGTHAGKPRVDGQDQQ
jgi:hypothetical protein